jgi:hypothetical protein
VEANEDFRFSHFAVSTSIHHPDCLMILAKTKVYAFMCTRQASLPLYFVATSPLCEKFFLKDQNFVDENQEFFWNMLECSIFGNEISKVIS